ncbi:50S ribosomal protein L34 [Candidatus Gracilibacteria bacterium]|nr:50S ribosomal protein L34 [Candidatus Gracilibacteria bacterium]
MLGKLKKGKRLRKHGFMSKKRMWKKSGKATPVIKGRRAKGRKSLAVTVHSK